MRHLKLFENFNQHIYDFTYKNGFIFICFDNSSVYFEYNNPKNAKYTIIYNSPVYKYINSDQFLNDLNDYIIQYPLLNSKKIQQKILQSCIVTDIFGNIKSWYIHDVYFVLMGIRMFDYPDYIRIKMRFSNNNTKTYYLDLVFIKKTKAIKVDTETDLPMLFGDQLHEFIEYLSDNDVAIEELIDNPDISVQEILYYLKQTYIE